MKLTTIMAGLLLALGGTAAAASPARAATAPVALARFDAAIAASKRAMVADADKAFRQATVARDIAAGLPGDAGGGIALATALWLQGESLIRLNQPERAGPITEQALRTVMQAAPGSKLHGDLLRSRGAVSAILGNVQPALADFQKAHDIFRVLGERRSQAMALQDIGAIYLDAGDYERVLRYNGQSAEAYDGDPSLLVTTYNNSGNALRELKRFAPAEAEYRRALVISRQIRSPLLQVHILTNLAQAQLLGGRLDAAAASLARSRAVAASDPAAAGWTPYISGVAAQLALARGDPGAAAALIARTFQGVDLATTNMSFRDFHSAAHRIYARLGDERLALAHLEAFKRLDDEARTLAASTNAQLMAAQFDFANQDLKIARLRGETLQRDVALERSRVRFRTTILVGALSAAAIVLVLLLIGYLSIRRSRNEVRAANDDLSLSNEALGKALRAKTEFLAMTSHEIRTPLNGILGMTQVILADRRIDGTTRERLGIVRSAGEAMRGLVDDILDVAKMEKGRLVMDPVDFDLRTALRETFALWAGAATAKGLSVTLDCDDGPGMIRADETRLRQIVSNLLSNAVKFTEAGSIGLVAVASAASTAGRTADDERLVLTVRDSGIGIPPDAIAGVFESFRQVDAGTTRRFGGTGLGLAICRNLAEAMGGTIDVESVLGEGSCFRVVLPLARVAGGECRPVPMDGAARAERLEDSVVLLMEGNPLTRSVLRAVLSPLVRGIEIVGDAEAARALLATRRFDQVVVDGAALAAGGADPLDVLRGLTDAAPDAAFVATWAAPAAGPPSAGRPAAGLSITGLPDAGLEADLRRRGVARVLPRPVAPATLVDALRTACEGEAADRSTGQEAGNAKLTLVAS